MFEIKVSFILNSSNVSVKTDPSRTLLSVLRDDFNLTGSKDGCSEGECGACTVLLNNRAVNSCLILIGQAEGAIVETIEGIGNKDKLHPLQKAFIEVGAVQCGYCTPGMIMSSKALLDKNPAPNDEEIHDALSGNLCRCTGYGKIIKAVKLASREMQDG